MKRYLICYDIADPRRLTRIHKLCKTYGIPLQYSVFLAELRRAQLDVLTESLRKLCHPEDDIRIYPLHNQDKGLVYGQDCLPEGVHLSTHLPLPRSLSATAPAGGKRSSI